MKIFKLKVGSSEIYELDKSTFELQTKQNLTEKSKYENSKLFSFKSAAF